jgi:hypothetical protein
VPLSAYRDKRRIQLFLLAHQSEIRVGTSKSEPALSVNRSLFYHVTYRHWFHRMQAELRENEVSREPTSADVSDSQFVQNATSSAVKSV